MWSLTEIIPDPLMITIVDIGAAFGEQPSYQALVELGKARIIGFEPNPEECEKLNRQYGKPHRFFPYFIGDGKPGVFHETVENLTGSLFEPNERLNEKFQNLVEFTKLVAKHPVNTTRLDDVDEIGDVDFIKIDVQGAELMVFKNAPRALEKALMVQAEVEFIPHYINQPLFADVDTELRCAGFQFHTFKGFGTRAFKPLIKQNPYEGFNQLIWSDAVYVRDWMNLSVLSTEKLKKYAILMNDVMRSYDLCHAVLDVIDSREGQRLAERYREWLIRPQ